MTDFGRHFTRVVSGRPVGNITPKSNKHGMDEYGRVFYIQSIEDAERRKQFAQYSRDKRHFTFTHMKNIQEVTEGMSNKYCGYLLMMQPHIQYETNILVEQGKDPTPLDINGIAKVFGVQRRYAKETIKKLEEQGVIINEHDEIFRINERYHFRKKAGVDVDMLIKTFNTTVKELKLKPAEMGVIYKLLPFVHYESNLICANPFEKDTKKVNFLNKTEIANLIGISRKSIEVTLRKLTAAGVVATIQRKSGLVPQDSGNDGRETVVLINPSVITRTREEPNSTVKQIFGI